MNAILYNLYIVVFTGIFCFDFLPVFSQSDIVKNEKVIQLYPEMTDSIFYADEANDSGKALGVSLFLSHSLYGGNISKYFTNPYFLGATAELYRKKWFLQIDDYIGLSATKEAMFFSGRSDLEENSLISTFLFGCNLGYSLVDTRKIKFAPLCGINVTTFTSNFFTHLDYEPFLPRYNLGFFIDIKPVAFLNKQLNIRDGDDDYSCLRLSFGINSPIGRPKYAEYFHGSLIYFTIGISGFF
ncbi:MAG: hypothetical protein LBT50_02510 [Prevotellaceae bacterium]|jgi:hypothetical protein|nr:hypothetical protein [Prevotellaceae bacterium]